MASYPNKGITPMKLQKLAYYTKVWTLVSGNAVVGADFQKWEFGPVNLDIYYAYKEFGAGVISSTSAVKPEMEKTQDVLCAFILDNYINLFSIRVECNDPQRGSVEQNCKKRDY